MDAIIVLLGLFVGIGIFLFVMDKITAIVYNCSSVCFTFLFCWGIGIVLAWIAWKIAIIVGIIGLILFLISKITGSKSKNKKNDTNSETNTNSDNTQSENKNDN